MTTLIIITALLVAYAFFRKTERYKAWRADRYAKKEARKRARVAEQTIAVARQAERKGKRGLSFGQFLFALALGTGAGLWYFGTPKPIATWWGETFFKEELPRPTVGLFTNVNFWVSDWVNCGAPHTAELRVRAYPTKTTLTHFSNGHEVLRIEYAGMRAERRGFNFEMPYTRESGVIDAPRFTNGNTIFEVSGVASDDFGSFEFQGELAVKYWQRDEPVMFGFRQIMSGPYKGKCQAIAVRW